MREISLRRTRVIFGSVLMAGMKYESFSFLTAVEVRFCDCLYDVVSFNLKNFLRFTV